MQNPTTADTLLFNPNCDYVVDYDTGLNFPEFFDPYANLPARRLIISSLYQKRFYEVEGQDSDEGATATELSNHIYELIENGKQRRIDGAIEYTIENLSVIIDSQDHKYSGKPLAGEPIKDTLMLAEYWSKISTTKEIVILTNSKLLKISAITAGKEHLNIKLFSPAPYSGHRRIWDEDAINFWRRNKIMSLKKWLELMPYAEPLNPHEFIMFGKTNSVGHIGRYDNVKKCIVPLTHYKALGITPIGELQAMAFEALAMDPDKENGTVVILLGTAGGGKTTAAISAAISLSNLKYIKGGGDAANKPKRRRRKRNEREAPTEEEHNEEYNDEPRYQRVVICPPDQMLGDKMGTLPGGPREKSSWKLNPYLDGIRTYLRLCGDKKEGGYVPNERDIDMRASSLMNRIEICTQGELNGRNFSNTFAFSDEAQFNTSAQIRAFIERCGCGSKAVLCGDPSQIPNPYGWYGNPLARAVRYLAKDPNVIIVLFDENSEILRPGARIVDRSWKR